MKTENRRITFGQAINEALDLSLGKNPKVLLIGEGVPDPKGIFGTTKGLQSKYGQLRVFDMPVSENGLTGICIGASISGYRPVLTHQRIDFSLLSMDQIVNNAAKWFFMFGGQKSVPIVIRMIIGRGWGQGAQHSQALQALYAHIPGLKVVMPYTPYDAKGMLIGCIEDNNPVIFIEHRWLHNLIGEVPEKYYSTNISKANIAVKGSDLTVVASSYMMLESVKAAKILKKAGISVEIIDLRSIKPIDRETIIKSVKKTGKLLVADTGYKTLGISSEVISEICVNAFGYLKVPPTQISLPDGPAPTSWKSAEKYYPTYMDILKKILLMMKFPSGKINKLLDNNKPDEGIMSDVPDLAFKGPF